jgi:hypothetical protein
MRMTRTRSRLALRLGLALAAACSPAGGCGGPGWSGGEGTAAPISPAMKKKVVENLKDYPKRAAERARARRSARP